MNSLPATPGFRHPASSADTAIPRTRQSALSLTGLPASLLAIALLFALSACQKDPAAPTAASDANNASSQPAEKEAEQAPAVPAHAPDVVVAVDAAPKPASTPEQKAAVVKSLNTIPLAFDPGQATVSDASLDAVKNAAVTLAATPDLRVKVSLASNGDEKLARARAEALKVQLIVNGVRASAIDTDVRAGQSSAADTISFVDAGPSRAR